MDIEKLIERLRTESLYADKASLEIMDLCMDAATAIETLQAENEKLRAEVESLQKEHCAGCSIPAVKAEQIRDLTDAPKLRAELEKVKQKYDEAREAICTHCMDVPCRGESCYWWCEPQKED